MNISKFRALMILALGLQAALLNVTAWANGVWPRMVESSDGTPIAYEVHGTGEPTLVLVHGWNCDGRYWREQIEHFSTRHRVVVVDLAGHGHSGFGRDVYTMSQFGEDVRAVVQDIGAKQVVLIGHSMGGPVIVEAARRMPERVIGLVGVDTFQHISGGMNQEVLNNQIEALQTDFVRRATDMVQQMFVESTDAELRGWILADMVSAPPEVAISAMKELLSDRASGAARSAFDDLKVPVFAINGEVWPTDLDSNRSHYQAFDAIILRGADHFLHISKPEAFNRALEPVIANIVSPQIEPAKRGGENKASGSN